MIILTGGSGMIGSVAAWHLNTIINDDKFVIVDEPLTPEQEKILAREGTSILLAKMILQAI